MSAEVSASPADFAVGAPLRTRLIAVGVGALLAAAAVLAQWWFVPFLTGLAFGTLGSVRRIRARAALWCAASAGSLGWTLPLLWRAAAGEPVVATARVAAALAGLPATGWLIIVLTLVVAGLQGLLGAWLGRSLSGPFVARWGRGRPEDS